MEGEGAPCCPGPVVHRRSKPPKPGKLQRCKHCRKHYVVGVHADLSGPIWPKNMVAEKEARGAPV